MDHSKTGDVAQWEERRVSNAKTLGSIHRRGSVRDSFSIPPCSPFLRLVCAWPPFLCTERTQMCAHAKDPISICRKRVGPHSRWYGNMKTAYGGKMITYRPTCHGSFRNFYLSVFDVVNLFLMSTNAFFPLISTAVLKAKFAENVHLVLSSLD